MSILIFADGEAVSKDFLSRAEEKRVATHLDCKELRCPMPIVKVGMAIRSLPVGDQLTVEATDPAFQPDLTAWARKTGHRIVAFEHGPIQRAVVEKC